MIRRRNGLFIALGTALAMVLASCGGGGVTAEDAESMRDDLETVEQRLEDIETQIAELEAEEVDAESVAAAVREALEEARETTEGVREGLEPPEPEPIPEDGGLGDPAAPSAPPATP